MAEREDLGGVPVTGGTVSVEAQWALYGKTTQDGGGYRVLGCSSGELTRGNFDEAVSRFLPGTPDAHKHPLPQVSVSYLAPKDRRGSYLALAIHKFAAAGEYDNVGREIMFTSYFCVPYAELAGKAITYQAMYEAFRGIRLPGRDGQPRRVEIDAIPSRVPAIDDMTVRVAALLVTGRPVCVLGAHETTMADRLVFIDTVMALLPYGMRSRMAAATWTRSTYRDHRFRLFFSSAARASGDQDHVVDWGHPDRIKISRAEGYACDYLSWLEDKIAQPVPRLSELTDERGFGQMHQWLERIGIASSEPGLAYAADGQDLLHPERPASRRESKSFLETTLLECVRQMMEQDTSGFKSSIAALRAYAAGGDGEQDRARCQRIITEGRLLAPSPRVGKLGMPFYDALLPLAFGAPLAYQGYCQLEDCLGNPPGQPPHRALLEAIDRAGTADPAVTAIVCWHLGEKRLAKWLQSDDINVEELIGWLAAWWDYPEHARTLCDATLEYLRTRQGHYHPRAVQAALRQHGYLASALHLRHLGDDQYQINTLWGFLSAAYPRRLHRSAVAEVLAGTSSPPTPALLAAVLMLLAQPADARLAEEAYAVSAITLMNLNEETRARLARHIPYLDSQLTMRTMALRTQPGAPPPPQPPSDAGVPARTGPQGVPATGKPPRRRRGLIRAEMTYPPQKLL